MIPFYMSRFEFIKEEQYKMLKNPTASREELDFLEKNIDETQRLLD